MKLVGSKLESQSLFKSPNYFPSYQFPYNPDPLCSGNNYRTYDEMQDDDQVKAALAIKKDMVVNTGWQIVCDDEDKKQYLTEALNRVNSEGGTGGTFDDVLRDMLSSYAYGFSLSEPVYRLDEAVGWWTLSEIHTRPPHSFEFDIDERARVKEIRQNASDKTHSFSTDIFLHHVYQMEFGNPYGKSDLRAAYTPWKAKHFVMRFYNIYLEKYASPLIVGKYKSSLSPAEIAEFQSILEKAQINTAMSIPEDVVVDIIQSARDGSSAFADAMDKYDTKIARAILMPDLLGFSGGKTGGGSYSLGKEQFKAFLGVIKKDRESLQAKITQRLIQPLAAINWGEDIAKTIRFEFIPFSDDNILEGAKVWSDAVRSVGWEASDEEINHMRAITGFPEGPIERKQVQEFDEEGNPIPPQNQPGKPGESGKKPASDDADESTDEGGDKSESEEKQFAVLHTYARKLTIYEKKVDFQGVGRVLAQSEARAIPALKRASKAIYDDLITQVREKGLLRRFKPEAVNALQPRFLKDMNMVFRNHFTDLFKLSLRSAKAEIYRDVKKFADDEPLFPDEFLEILKAESFKVVGDYSTDITKRARNIVLQGIKDGVAQGEIVTLLREELGAYTERWLATVVRTKTTEIYNDARKSFWDSDPVAAQIIEAYQFSAVLDDRTTDVCRELDQQIFDKGGFLDKITPPLHFNCRSLLVPITRYEPYKDDAKYVARGDEPSLDDLKDMGGNLIVGTTK